MDVFIKRKNKNEKTLCFLKKLFDIFESLYYFEKFYCNQNIILISF